MRKFFISLVAIIIVVCSIATIMHYFEYREKTFDEITNNLTERISYAVDLDDNEKMSADDTERFLTSLKGVEFKRDRGLAGSAIPNKLAFYDSADNFLFEVSVIGNAQMFVTIDDEKILYSMDNYH